MCSTHQFCSWAAVHSLGHLCQPGRSMRVFPLLRSGALLDLGHVQSWGCAAFQGCLLQNWCVGLAESLRLVLLCWDNPAAAVRVPLWFLWLQQSCRDTGNLALTPAGLVEMRHIILIEPVYHCPISAKGGVKIKSQIWFPRMSGRQSSPITSPPGMPAACALSPVPLWVGCGAVMWCQQFPVMASLLVTARGKKWVFVDEVVLKFDWDLLSVVIQCRKCSQWISGEELCARQQEIKSTELLSWSCCIWYCLWGSVECTSLILDDA